MKKQILTLLAVMLAFSLSAQVEILNRLGQTPGSAGFHVNYDSLNQKLIVGCGTSVWIYDTHDTADYHVIAKRPLLGLVGETEVYGDVLFVAATHHGIFALDYTSDSLDILAHYNMQEMGDTAAYDMWRSNDTLFIADNFLVRMLKYTPGSGFTKIGSFGGPGANCVSRRNNFVAVGNQGLTGNIQVYDIQNLSTPDATWTNSAIFNVQDLQFADLRNDIIYVCGGAGDLFSTKSSFIALLFTGDSLTFIDSLTVSGGIPGYAQMNIMNMDSRNDTLYIVTTAAYDLSIFPYAYMPIVDATGLPGDSLKKIGFVVPGLWHFDAALMDGTPYIAMSSEWCGVLVSDISQLAPDDTLGFLETGGWCMGSKIRHDTLWAFHEGYGLVAYKLDSLYYHNGYMTDSKLMHIYEQFVSDFEFLNDSLIILSTGYGNIYNIKSWLSGGFPVRVDSLGVGNNVQLKLVQTNVGPRLVTGWSNILAPPEAILLLDPFDPVHPKPIIDSVQTRCNLFSICMSNDTLFCGLKFNNKNYLAAYKVADDAFTFIDSVIVPGEINGVAAENGVIAVSTWMNLKWYSINGGQITELGAFFDWFINPQGIHLKNKMLYVADKFYGVKVFDLSQAPQATLVAKCRGTGGYKNVFGSNFINVGDDGQIYLSDFHAGIIIIEAYDTILANITDFPITGFNHKIVIYPNPADNYFVIRFDDELKFPNATVKILNSLGKKVMEIPLSSSDEMIVDTHKLSSGIYFIKITDSNKIVAVGKIIIE
ncbi:MAG: T9SS type A sorting domain-containing protein [Bacteroidota bacterium]